MPEQLIGLVSPRDHKAAKLSFGSGTPSTAKAVCADGSTYSAGNYFSRFPATGFVSFGNLEELKAAEANSAEQACALDFLLMLFDTELSDSLKRDVVVELEQLLAVQRNLDYVEDILFSQPLPNGVDLDAVAGKTRNTPRVKKLISDLSRLHTNIGYAFTAWLEILSDPLVQSLDEKSLRGSLIGSGLIRKLVSTGTTQVEVGAILGNLLFSNENTGAINARVLQRYINAYKKHLPVGQKVDRKLSRPETSATKAFVDETLEEVSIDRKRNAILKQEQAVKEVEAIADHYLKGEDGKADNFKKQLIERQSQETDRSYLVKSLCNIARRCSSGGRKDIAAQCLDLAAQESVGIDFKLFLQMGELFKDLHNFDEASDCYQKAASLANDSAESETVNRELARLLTARGDYPAALEAFRRLRDDDNSIYVQTSMATVLRKMGNLQAARQLYDSVYSGNQNHHQALAGLAETNRQSGRFRKAIIKYNAAIGLLKQDTSAERVYHTALSSLYCVTGHLPKAEAILRGLLQKHEQDSSLQLSLAKVLRLRGQLEEADKLYKKSFTYLEQTDRLALQLYTNVFGNSDNGQLKTPHKVLPELAGLARCSFSFQNIVACNFDDVLRTPPVNHVYRLHGNFESLLRYHAQLAVNPNFNRTANIAINRLRKRGVKELRLAVRAIDELQFDVALENEKRMCLMMA